MQDEGHNVPTFEPTAIASAVVAAIREAGDVAIIPRRVSTKGDWYEVKAAGESAEMYIYGDIGTDPWADESVDAKSVVNALSQIDSGARINAHVNSYGGSVADGLAIYNALRRHPGGVDVSVDGVAVSIASLIAMAGDTVRMASNAMLMIHAPWNMSIGNANDHRKTADMLDKHAEAMAGAYARNGFSRDDALAMLKDGEDHWLTAAEAVDMGLADEITESLAVAASLPDRFNPPAGAAGKQLEEPIMATTQNPAAPAEPTANVTEIENAAMARVKARNAEVRAMFQPQMHVAGVPDLLNTIIDDPKISVEAAGLKLLAKLAEGAEPVNKPAKDPSVQAGMDDSEKWKIGVKAALYHRMGTAKDDRANEYRGRSLAELAEMSLVRAGVNTRGMTKSEIASKVLASHSTSDFPLLLADAANKSLQAAYETFPATWSRWCATSEVPDFKVNNRIRLGSFNSLATIAEGGEYTQGTVGEEREQITAATKGKFIQMTRQMLVNDDLAGFNRMAQLLGRAAARTVNADAYGIINANAAMSDGVALFHASHANLSGSNTAVTVASLSAGKAAMRKQTGPGTNATEYLNIMPAYLLVPVAIEDIALEVITSTTNVAKSNSNAANPVRNMAEIVSDPILDATSATAWYLAASPMVAPLVEVAFLDGQQSPFVASEEEFLTDAVRWKVRLDYGVAAIDYRGGYKNAGA